MNEAWKRIIASRHAARKAGAALALGLGLGLAGGVQAQDNPVQENKEQLERLRARIETLQKSLDQDRNQRDELRNQLETSERRMADLSGQLDGLRRRISEQTRQLRKTTAERAEAETVLRRHRSTLSRQVRAAYVIGQRGQTRLLLNQDGSQRLSRVMTYYDYLNRARAKRIAAILEQVQTLEALARKLKNDSAALQAVRNEQLGTLTVLEATRVERAGMVRSLAERIKDEEGELKQLHADERELAQLLKQLRSALADVPVNLGSKPFVQLKGRLNWPLRGKLLARYGDPKAGGKLKWNGLWIAGKEGEPVLAVARGRVAYVGWMHRYGLITVLEHEGGYYSLYGHSQSVAAGVGDWVQAGDIIASVGATGGHEKTGLYFELRKGTDAINPKPWLKVKG